MKKYILVWRSDEIAVVVEVIESSIKSEKTQ